MTLTQPTLPIAHARSPQLQPSTPTATPLQSGQPSYAEVASLLNKLQHQHHLGTSHDSKNGSNSMSSATDSDTDPFGVSNASAPASTDAFGVASLTNSSTAPLVAQISDPFSSIASQMAIQAQFSLLQPSTL
jgi:hypothetical protein